MARMKTQTGRLTLTARGFGFVQPADAPSILVPFDHLSNALSGDTVEVELLAGATPDKPAGRIVRVVERDAAPIIGRVRRHGREVRLYPAASRSARALVIDPKSLDRLGLKQPVEDGDVLGAQLVRWDDPASHPTGAAAELVARRDDADLELKLIALSRRFPLEFPPDVERQAQSIRLPGRRNRPGGRRDLTGLTCFTIDPEAARDFDDAMSVEQLPSGLFRLGVHIADVSAYVAQGDPVDREAWNRGTSVYLVNTVLPMLPERLSNELCSLVPGRPRLTVSVVVTLDSMGTIHDVEMGESTIRSRHRFTYREVEAILNGASHRLAPQLHLLRLVAAVLKTRRQELGSVDLDLSTPQIRLDENGVPISVRPSERLEANRLVEECMLLANRVVAEHLERHGLTTVYRIHDEPSPGDIEALVSTLRDLGIPYKVGDQVTPGDYRAILSFIQNFEFSDLIEAIALKGLKKAVYSTENRGHFGLAMKAYTHFTSPIRRYPDLVVHRLLKESLAAGATPSRKGRAASVYAEADLRTTCAHATERERAATDAEREYSRLKALEFLKTRIGRRYRGVVSGVASIGLFVEIERYLIDGLVHISTLGKERFELDRSSYRLVGGRTGKVYRLGDTVHVEVKAVDTRERRADFVLVPDTGDQDVPTGGGASKRAGRG